MTQTHTLQVLFPLLTSTFRDSLKQLTHHRNRITFAHKPSRASKPILSHASHVGATARLLVTLICVCPLESKELTNLPAPIRGPWTVTDVCVFIYMHVVSLMGSSLALWYSIIFIDPPIPNLITCACGYAINWYYDKLHRLNSLFFYLSILFILPRLHLSHFMCQTLW